MRKGVYSEKRVRKVRFNESVAQCVLVEGGVQVLSSTRLHELEASGVGGARRRRWEYDRVVTAADIAPFLPVETQRVENGVIVGENEVVDVPGETLVLLEDTSYLLGGGTLKSTTTAAAAAAGPAGPAVPASSGGRGCDDSGTLRRHRSLYNPTFLFESDGDDSETETETEEDSAERSASKASEEAKMKIHLYRHTSDDSTRVNSIATSPQLSQAPLFKQADTS